MVEERIFQWRNGALIEERPDFTIGRIATTDSFRVDEGMVIGESHHRARFLRSLPSARQGDAAAFLAESSTHIPLTGQWFPRFDAIADGVSFLFRLRPAPEASTEVDLATASRDPRTMPDTKGPDLEALGALRAELNCGEAIIVHNGTIAEGAYSSIVWWSDETLTVVAPDIPRLPGITETILREQAAYLGAPIRESHATPHDLDGAEVWVLSSLHGIRVATTWHNGPSLTSEPGRAEYWRTFYATRREPLGTAHN